MEGARGGGSRFHTSKIGTTLSSHKQRPKIATVRRATRSADRDVGQADGGQATGGATATRTRHHRSQGGAGCAARRGHRHGVE
eukprot:scaffold11839_cov124-Isochrysis_galbana.AAC.1